MIAWLALFVSVGSLCVMGYFYRRFCKKDDRSREKIKNEIEALLTEFNSVSNEKIELLDNSTEELRGVVDLADLKISKLNRLIDRAEGLSKVLKEERGRQRRQAESSESMSQSHREQVISLAEQGYSSAQIAEKTGIKPGEVSVIIRLNRSRLTGAAKQ